MKTPRADATRAAHARACVRRVMAVGLTIGMVSGCAGEQEPPPRPELVWVDGAPTGELESDEWVRAAREADFAEAWASNVADFSLPALSSTWNDFAIESFVSRVEADLLHKRPRVYLGPRPMAPVLVAVDDDGRGAVVAACVDALDTKPADDDGNDWPLLRYYPLELTTDGERRMARGRSPQEPFTLPDGTELSDDYCDTLAIPRAVFDPAPDLEALARKDMDDVVAPTYAPTP